MRAREVTLQKKRTSFNNWLVSIPDHSCYIPITSVLAIKGMVYQRQTSLTSNLNPSRTKNIVVVL